MTVTAAPEPLTPQDAADWLRLALEAAGASAWEWDIAHDHVAWSDRQYDLFGADPTQVTPSYESFIAFVHPDDRTRVTAYVSETVARQREPHEQEFRVVRPNGEVRYLLSRARLLLDPIGQPHKLVGIDVDITERKRLEQALRQSEARFRTVLAQSPIVVFAQDGALRYTWMYNSLVGFRIRDVLGKTDAELFAPEPAAALQAAKKRVLTTGVAERIEVALTRDGDGEPVVCDLYLEPLREGAEIVGISGTGTDVSERKRLEQQIERMALHDPLTDLPNRTLFHRGLGAALARARRARTAVAVMLIDLDGFKQVNDTYGHVIGDRLLVEVARRLRCCVREGDLIARLGGDEFVIVAEDRGGDGGFGAVADRLVAALGERARLDQVELDPSGSIGLTVNARGAGDPDEILARADQALYAAKAAGRGCWVAFDDAITPTGRRRDRSARAG